MPSLNWKSLLMMWSAAMAQPWVSLMKPAVLLKKPRHSHEAEARTMLIDAFLVDTLEEVSYPPFAEFLRPDLWLDRPPDTGKPNRTIKVGTTE